MHIFHQWSRWSEPIDKRMTYQKISDIEKTAVYWCKIQKCCCKICNLVEEKTVKGTDIELE